MKIELVKISTRRFIGLETRTRNQNEMNPLTAKIWPLIQKYQGEEIAKRIPHRKSPGVTFCSYNDYASDFNGDYTYFIGEEVDTGTNAPEGLTILDTPPQTYAKFTSSPGPQLMVELIAWQEIWKLTEKDMGGKRSYKTDFVVYNSWDLTAQDAVVDLYIGITE